MHACTSMHASVRHAVSKDEMSTSMKHLHGSVIALIQQSPCRIPLSSHSTFNLSIAPPHQVDVSAMDLNGKLELGTLAAMLPEGTKLIAKDMKHPVVKVAGRGNR